jgi:hypothetical protein
MWEGELAEAVLGVWRRARKRRQGRERGEKGEKEARREVIVERGRGIVMGFYSFILL